MDKSKQDKLDSFTTSRFSEISQQIKESIALLTQLSNPLFQFAQPIENSAPISNSNCLDIPHFAFSEPLQKLKVKDSASIDKLAEKISSLNIRGTEYESIVKIQCSDEEIVSNDGNENISGRLDDCKDSTIPWNWSNKMLDKVVSSDSLLVDNCKGQDVDGDLTADDYNTNIQISSQQVNCFSEPDVKFELDSNVCIQEFSVHFNSFIEQGADNSALSIDIDKNDACTDGNKSIQTLRLQKNCNEELDVDNNSSSENIPASSAKLTCCVEQGIASNVLLKDVNENIPSPNIQDVDNVNDKCPADTPSSGDIDQITHFEVDSVKWTCYEEQDLYRDALPKDVNENIPSPNIEITASKTPDVDNSTPSDNSPSVACRSVDENIPSPNIEITASKTQDVNNSTPSDNSPPVACRSGDIDPNTQVTHLEVDSRNQPFQKFYADQPQPFLIRHIHKITWSNQNEAAFASVMELFGQKFKTVMIYGAVTSLTVEQGGLTQRFVIDDGSGSINVVWKASRQILDLLKTIKHLNEEVKQCRQSGLSVVNENWQPNSKECKDMLDSFDTILHYIKRQITERTKLNLFGYAGVVGKPFRSKDKKIVQVHAAHIEDNSRDRSLELYFKKNLIRLYNEKYILDS